ncbi:unnamed protein product [Protopolystoma xenopodis]|uniref:Uncharacterized protein n=1 Tax=Protopolystoma xenopodis TaxID=117903 RepID=A0A3S5BQE0_9PLAT|nr:unnamed protein product [Protopolystoma xenopodis]
MTMLLCVSCECDLVALWVLAAPIIYNLAPSAYEPHLDFQNQVKLSTFSVGSWFYRFIRVYTMLFHVVPPLSLSFSLHSFLLYGFTGASLPLRRFSVCSLDRRLPSRSTTWIELVMSLSGFLGPSFDTITSIRSKHNDLSPQLFVPIAEHLDASFGCELGWIFGRFATLGQFARGHF